MSILALSHTKTSGSRCRRIYQEDLLMSLRVLATGIQGENEGIVSGTNSEISALRNGIVEMRVVEDEPRRNNYELMQGYHVIRILETPFRNFRLLENR